MKLENTIMVMAYPLAIAVKHSQMIF